MPLLIPESLTLSRRRVAKMPLLKRDLHAKLCLLTYTVYVFRAMAMDGHKSEGFAMGQVGGNEGPTCARAVMNAAPVYPTDP